MFARRPRMNRRGIGAPVVGGSPSPPPAPDPPDVIFGADNFDWWDPDTGFTPAQWTGRINSNTFDQATGANQPTMGTNAPGGGTSIEFDGSNDGMVCAAFAPVAPATTPVFMWIIARINAWAANDTLLGCENGRMQAIQITAEPQLFMRNGVAVNGISPVIGDWYLFEMLFSGSTSDSLRAGASHAATGSSAGNNDPTGGLGLACVASGSLPMNCSVSHLGVALVAPTNEQLFELRAWALAECPGLDVGPTS